MPQGQYLPEGWEPQPAFLSEEEIWQAKKEGGKMEGIAVLCTEQLDLYVHFSGQKGVIPREEAGLGANNGKMREIAVLSRVGKAVCFRIIGRRADGVWLLSRRIVQEEAWSRMLQSYQPGDILRARVTHLEQFGAFVDIGCGIVSMIGIENITVSRIRSAKERFYQGQDIFCVVLRTDAIGERIYLSHRELLGTWEENAARFSPGYAVEGIIRGVEPYGTFIELAPNLSGLADADEEAVPGMKANVLIRSIQPDRMKIKLNLLEKSAGDGCRHIRRSDYVRTEGRLLRWQYQPECCLRHCIETDFR